MEIVTIDFETYYDKTYSLKNKTTEEYLRDPRFEVIGVAVKVGNHPTDWISGTHPEIRNTLHGIDWSNKAVLAHNTMFDGAILSWLFGVRPKVLLDTLCMARSIHGVEAGGSLKALAERYGIGEKGTEVINALGKRRVDFTAEELARYGEYCKNDVELTYKLFEILSEGYPRQELKVIDATLKMFTEPVLELDIPLLEQHLLDVKTKKEKLLEAATADKDVLMSNDKFAELLQQLGVQPPTKISARTGKEAWAFAKTDEEFKALLEHPDARVQTLVAARLGTKTTLEESRTERFINIGRRGLMPVPLRYYAAHTGRWGGDDKINLQNLPSRGANGNKLKQSIRAPAGYLLIDSDSSQIEARILAWLAGQDDLVTAFANGEDVYKIMASSIYAKPVEEITKEERFVGKTTILGCIAEGTLVLSHTGWKPIESVTTDDMLWDGEEWVCHQGLLNSGMKETLNLCGIWLTPDHKVLSGTHWLEAQLVAADENTLCQALDTGAENLPLQGTSGVLALESKPSLSNAIAATLNTQLTIKTSKTLKAQDVRFALKKPQIKKDTGYTRALYRITNSVLDYLIDYRLQLAGATAPQTKTISITERAASGFVTNGEATGPHFSNTFKRLMGGTTRILKSIELMSMEIMNPEILGLHQEAKILKTNEKSQILRRKLQTYDIAYSGPRNRFTVLTNRGPIVVHNCGYGMGAAKFQAQLKTFGVDTDLEEAKRIITVYRETYPRIPELWKQAQKCLGCIVTKTVSNLGRAGVLEFDPSRSGFLLPNGLWQRYDGLTKQIDETGKEQYVYPTRRGAVKIYGGKIVENICQALARCVIAEQLVKINSKYKVVLTVHDAVACVAKKEIAQQARDYVEQCMRATPKWAEGLPLNCESGMGESYGDC